MADEDNIKRNREFLKILDNMIDKGPWEESLFLRATGDKLKKLRDHFKSVADFGHHEAEAVSELGLLAKPAAERAGWVKVYIELYCSDGSELKNWEKLLNNLKAVLITRPILANENDVKELIRAKAKKNNEAYLAVLIDKGDIMQPIGGKPPRDALGHELLALREGAVKLENISHFVHISGRYQFKQGRLVE